MYLKRLVEKTYAAYIIDRHLHIFMGIFTLNDVDVRLLQGRGCKEGWDH